MKRLLAASLAAVAMLAVGAPAAHAADPECKEILIHFRPRVCYDPDVGNYGQLVVCPDGPGFCVPIVGHPIG